METTAISETSKKITLITTTIVAFVGSLMGSAITIALPTIGQELAASAVMLSWVANSMALSQALILIPAGRLADIVGRKKILIYSAVCFAFSSFLCGISNSPLMLIIFRFIQGFCAGFVIVPAIALVTSVFPAHERGKALGINAGGVYVGLAIGPAVGGFMTQYLGWRSIFFLGGILCLISAILVARSLKGEWADAKGEKFDTTGSVIFFFALLLVMYGFSILPAVWGFTMIVAGTAGLLTFVRWEARSPSPIFNVSLFRRNKIFIFSNLATLINYLAAFALTFLLSLYLQFVRGFPPQTAGLILICQPVMMVICSPLAGRLSDKVDAHLVASAGMAVTCLSLIIFCFINESTPLWVIIAALMISGTGLGFFSSPNTNSVMSSVDKKLLGVASGAVGTMRSCGMALSAGIMMILFTIYIGNAQITRENSPAFLTSMQVGFIIYTIICFAGIFAQMVGTRIKKRAFDSHSSAHL
jgi:EmrB/QacA subfamily drug resistance transporter